MLDNEKGYKEWMREALRSRSEIADLKRKFENPKESNLLLNGCENVECKYFSDQYKNHCVLSEGFYKGQLPTACKNYFSVDEQSCSCCNLNLAPKWYLDKMNEVREFAGVPIYVNSWTRCELHNEEVGGSPTSTHKEGIATDIRLNKNKNSQMTPYERSVLTVALVMAGFKRIIYYKTFIHADMDPQKPQAVGIAGSVKWK